MIEEWKQALDKDKKVGIIFMDLSKAFDKICSKLFVGTISKGKYK